MEKIALSVRNKAIDPHEDDKQDKEGEDRSLIDQHSHQGCQKLKMDINKVVELMAEYPQEQHGYDDYGKDQGVYKAKEPQDKKVTVIFDIIYGVQAFNDGVDPLGGGPEGQHDG